MTYQTIVIYYSQMKFFTLIFITISLSAPISAAQLERTFFLMGSHFEMSLSAKAEKQLIKASEEIAKQLNRFEQKISTWKSDSEFSQFNTAPTGTQFHFTKNVKMALDTAHSCHQLTNGFFHPGLGKLITAWGLRKTGSIPQSSDLQSLIKSASFHHLKKRGNAYSKTDADFYLEEGGFAKGAALDIARKIAQQFSLTNYYFNFSGQILSKSKQSLLISHPDQRTQAVIELPLENGSLSTSANTVQQFSVNRKTFGHILDPLTGSPLQLFHRSISVIAPSGTKADCLSTGLFVMSNKPQIFFEWIKAHPEFSVIEITGEENKLKVQASCNLKNKIKMIHPEMTINYLCT